MVKFWRKMDQPRSGESSTLRPMPIIVGSPRSGTTLLRFMLDAHSELAIPPETGFLTLSRTIRGKGDELRENFFHAVVNYSEPSLSWPDFEIPNEVFWTALKKITPFNISEGYRTFYRLYADRFGKPRWGDKTPIYCRYIESIRGVLPEARFVHIIRDGRDAALSLRRMWFSPGWEIETQASYWRDGVLAARRAGVGRDDYMEIRYEELVLNTPEILERVCAHLALSFEDAMLSYYMRARERLKEHKGRLLPSGAVLTQQQRFQQQQRTTNPPDPTCVFGWKQTMEPEERKRFQLVAGDLLKELGYEL
jgi:hypothetical protein